MIPGLMCNIPGKMSRGAHHNFLRDWKNGSYADGWDKSADVTRA